MRCRQTPDIHLHPRLDAIDVEISDKHECEVTRVGEPRLKERQRLIKVHLVKEFGGEGSCAKMVLCQHCRQGVAERHVRRRISVRIVVGRCRLSVHTDAP